MSFGAHGTLLLVHIFIIVRSEEWEESRIPIRLYI
jgi:hypothetical protein